MNNPTADTLSLSPMSTGPTTGSLTLTGTFTPPTPPPLELLWDDISNVPVSNPNDVDEWNTFFDLPANGTPFTGVDINGNLVQLYGGSGITLWGTSAPDTGVFLNNVYLIRITDYTGCIIAMNDRSLETNDSTLTTVILNSCVSAGYYSCDSNTGMRVCEMNALENSGEGAFSGNSDVEEFNFPSLKTAGSSCFSGNFQNAKRFVLQALETIGSSCFQSAEAVEEIDIRSCLTMGVAVTDDTVFQGITGQTITLTVPAALMTCNAGAPHASIQYLIDNNTVTVIEV